MCKAPSRWPESWLNSLRSEEHLCSCTFQYFYFNTSQRSDFGETDMSQTDYLLKISLIPSFFCWFPNHMLTTVTHLSIMQAVKSYNLSLLFWSQKRHRLYDLTVDQIKCWKVNPSQTETKRQTLWVFSPFSVVLQRLYHGRLSPLASLAIGIAKHYYYVFMIWHKIFQY